MSITGVGSICDYCHSEDGGEGPWTFLYIYYSSMCSFLLGQAENKSMSITAWDIRDQFVIIVSLRPGGGGEVCYRTVMTTQLRVK
jgi:hypothetical protein